MTVLLAKTFSIESRELLFQLRQPYFQEDLLRPVFVWGTGVGAVLLLTALLMRDDRLKMTAFIFLAAAGLSVIPYLNIRAKAVKEPHPGPEPSARVARLREDSRWVFLTLGSLALGTAIWGARTRFGGALTIATLLSGFIATGTGAWLEAHDSGAMHFTGRGGGRSGTPRGSEGAEAPASALAPSRSNPNRPAPSRTPAPRPTAAPARPAAEAPPRSLPAERSR